MSIQQSTQPQVIDIRSTNTKVHVSGCQCTILSKEPTNGLLSGEECISFTIGDKTVKLGDIILAEDINIKLVLPFKIARISEFDTSKALRKVTLYSFKENPTSVFLIHSIGNIAKKITESPLYQGSFAYYPELEGEQYRYAVFFLLHYNKQIRNSDKFKELQEIIDNQLLDEEYVFTTPFNNDNYRVLTCFAKHYWQEEYNLILRGSYSKLPPVYLTHLKNQLPKNEYNFIAGIVTKSEILTKIWEEKLNMTLPNDIELYNKLDIEDIDGLYENQLISNEDYERVKNLAGYMV